MTRLLRRMTHSERVGFQILVIAVISGAVGAALTWLLRALVVH